MILIIAEKPSLARNITAGIGNLQKKNGYFEGQGYIISWAFGHLFSLAEKINHAEAIRRPPPKKPEILTF